MMLIYDMIKCVRCRGVYSATSLLCNAGHWTCVICLDTQSICGFITVENLNCSLPVIDDYFHQLHLMRSYFCRLPYDGEPPIVGNIIY